MDWMQILRGLRQTVSAFFWAAPRLFSSSEPCASIGPHEVIQVNDFPVCAGPQPGMAQPKSRVSHLPVERILIRAHFLGAEEYSVADVTGAETRMGQIRVERCVTTFAFEDETGE
jgi:hypothetical protein